MSEENQNSIQNQDTVNVFVCYDAPVLQMATEVLKEHGIDYLVRNHSLYPFATNMGTGTEQVLAVLPNHADQARAELKKAISEERIAGEHKIVE